MRFHIGPRRAYTDAARTRCGCDGPGGSVQREGGRKAMYSNLVMIFNFIISQWSLSPQAFKDAVLAAEFPSNPALSTFQKLLNTRPAKLVVLVLDVTLIDVFLFFAGVALLDLHRGFSVFSLWTAALFSFLFAYMVMVAHSDIKKY